MSSKWKVVDFQEITEFIKKGIFEILSSEYVDLGVPFIRVANIKETGEIEEKGMVCISEEKNREECKTTLRPGDLVVAKSGATFGKVAIIPPSIPRCNISQDVIGIRLKKGVDPYYALAYFATRFGRSQLLRGKTQQVIPHLTLDILRTAKVIIPDSATQDRVSRSYCQAMESAKDYLQKAEKSTLSLRSHVASELGLDVSTQDKEVPMHFFMSSSRIDGRFDPGHYSDMTYPDLKFPSLTLEEIASSIESGRRPKGGVSKYREGVPSIGGENITSTGEIDLSELKLVPYDFYSRMTTGRLQPNDILIVKDGATTGKVAILPGNLVFTDLGVNEHVFRVRLRDQYDPEYVFAFLWSSIGQMQIKREVSGAAQRGITHDFAKRIRIAMPDRETQQRIGIRFRDVRNQVAGLKVEAVKSREDALRSIEKILAP
jgi:restriction endonuclease S subunit